MTPYLLSVQRNHDFLESSILFRTTCVVIYLAGSNLSPLCNVIPVAKVLHPMKFSPRITHYYVVEDFDTLNISICFISTNVTVLKRELPDYVQSLFRTAYVTLRYTFVFLIVTQVCYSLFFPIFSFLFYLFIPLNTCS